MIILTDLTLDNIIYTNLQASVCVFCMYQYMQFSLRFSIELSPYQRDSGIFCCTLL